MRCGWSFILMKILSTKVLKLCIIYSLVLIKVLNWYIQISILSLHIYSYSETYNDETCLYEYEGTMGILNLTIIAQEKIERFKAKDFNLDCTYKIEVEENWMVSRNIFYCFWYLQAFSFVSDFITIWNVFSRQTKRLWEKFGASLRWRHRFRTVSSFEWLIDELVNIMLNCWKLVLIFY